MKILLALLAALLPALVSAQTNYPYWNSTFSSRAADVVICAPDTPNKQGCDVTTTGLVGSAGSVTGAEVAINAQISTCGTSQQPTFTAYISTTTMTVTTFASGNAIYVGMPVNGTGVTSGTIVTALGTGTGGAGTYTVNHSQTVSSSPGETMTGPIGACHILLRPGTYNTCGSITINRSWITLEGEENPMWGNYLTQQSGSGSVGGVSTGMAKIQANGTTGNYCSGNVDGYDLITSAGSFTDNSETRRRGWRVAYLYLVGAQATPNYWIGANQPNGILLANNDDSVVIDHIFAQHLGTGVNAKGDNTQLFDINVQDSYDGIAFGATFSRGTQLTVYDVDDVGINCSGFSTLTNSSVGDTVSYSIVSTGCAVVGNYITSGESSAIRTAPNGTEYGVISGNIIDETSGQFSGGGYKTNRASSGVAAINVVGSNATIVGNTLIGSTEGSGFYAISLGSNIGSLVANNNIIGSWNGGSQPYVNFSSATNRLAYNYGDSVTGSGGLSGTTGSIGGSALSAGACATGTASVNGAPTSGAVIVSPNTYPGAGFSWDGYVSAAGTVTVAVCAEAAGTPTSSTYNVRVIQ